MLCATQNRHSSGRCYSNPENSGSSGGDGTVTASSSALNRLGKSLPGWCNDDNHSSAGNTSEGDLAKPSTNQLSEFDPGWRDSDCAAITKQAAVGTSQAGVSCDVPHACYLQSHLG